MRGSALSCPRCSHIAAGTLRTNDPGYFCFSHDDLSFSVFFMPAWDNLILVVQDIEGDCYEDHGTFLPLQRESYTGTTLLDLMRPTLDKLLTLSRTA